MGGTAGGVAAVVGNRQTELLFTRAAILSGLDAGDTATLGAHMGRVEFRAGDAIYTDGEQGGRLYIVIAGKVKIGWRSPFTAEKLLAIMGPSDVFGVESLFDGGPHASSATAITDGVAAVLDQDAMHACIDDRPQLLEQFMRILARYLERAEDHIAGLNFSDVPGRIARQLLQLNDRFGARHGREVCVSHGLTQREFAQLVGTSRESVNKVLAEFVQRGWITLDGKSVIIHQMEALSRRAQ